MLNTNRIRERIAGALAAVARFVAAALTPPPPSILPPPEPRPRF